MSIAGKRAKGGCARETRSLRRGRRANGRITLHVAEGAEATDDLQQTEILYRPDREKRSNVQQQQQQQQQQQHQDQISSIEMHVLCDCCGSEAALPVAALRSPRLRAETLPALRSSDGVAPSIVKRLASDKPRQALPSIEVMYQVPLKSARLYNTLLLIECARPTTSPSAPTSKLQNFKDVRRAVHNPWQRCRVMSVLGAKKCVKKHKRVKDKL
ncbi:hypothetical protein E4U14_004283 [Claviceps sp. LM454 group G7]|nr:hypothetical protein E4U14_004283 [Claviceps sp. LM454 group G7]